MTSRLRPSLACVVLLLTLACSAAVAQQATSDTRMPDSIPVPAAAQPSPNFNAEAATDAYLAEMPATARARSDAYFEGGYWLILWDFLYGAVIALILLNLRWSAAMRNLAERITRFKPLQTAIYWIQYLILTTILGFPLAVYEGFTREKKYGLATQTFGRLDGRSGKRIAVEPGAWRHHPDNSVRLGSQTSPHLVDLGSGSQHDLHCVRCAD